MSRENLETILNALIPFARIELERMGSVPPVAGSLGGDGDVELHMPRDGDGATTDELLDLLRRELRHGAERGRYLATGLCMEVRAERTGSDALVDAICVHLEAPGESLMAFLPYRRDDQGDLVYEDLFFGPADPVAFV